MMCFARILVAAATVAAAACGASVGGAAVEMGTVRGGAVDLWVTSGEEVLPVYEADGRRYLLGERGRGYSIWIANRTGGRVEAVVSVDGRDAVSGRRADFRRDRGYVLEPGEELAIDGFRRSLDQVAAFEFTAPGESYASRMGDGSSIGVIGLAVFDEDEARSRPAPIAGDDDRDRSYAEGRRPQPSTQAPPPRDSAGRAQVVEAEMAADEPGLGTRSGNMHQFGRASR